MSQDEVPAEARESEEAGETLDASGVLEQALARTEADAETIVKAANAVTSAAKRFRTAAHVGNLRDLRAAMGTAEQASDALRRELAAAREGWDFDEDAYFGGTAFTRELLETAARMNVRLYEQDERLYSYPSLIRVLPNDRAVMIDKTRERRVRPSVLVSQLRDLQKKPARFRPEAFLEALCSAYERLAAGRGGMGTVVRLLEIYDLLTLLPGQSREYSRQEFARDIYLFDQSGVTVTRKGYRVRFPASTGTKVAAGTVRVVTQDGQEKVYYGISFTPPDTAPE